MVKYYVNTKHVKPAWSTGLEVYGIEIPQAVFEGGNTAVV